MRRRSLGEFCSRLRYNSLGTIEEKFDMLTFGSCRSLPFNVGEVFSFVT